MLKPTQLRNATWTEVCGHITADMRRVHAAWRVHGPGTTKQVAERAEISLLTFRPRTTDLYHLGLVECVARAGNAGVYAYRSEEDAERAQCWRDESRGGGKTKQEARATFGATAMQTVTFASEAHRVAWAASIMSKFGKQKRRRAVPALAQQLELLSA